MGWRMTDWAIIIAQIRRHGRLRLTDIAGRCECSEGALSDILYRRTKEPKHALGERLLALHSQIMAKVSQETGNSVTTRLQCA